MSNRTYVILTAPEASNINYDDVLETSVDTLRWNNDNTKTFVKFDGSTPGWLSGKATKTNTQMRSLLNDADGEWYTDPF